MRLAMTVLSLALLSGCGGDAADKGPERPTAAGEVLGGEVTDDMLPLDTARSTSPAGSQPGQDEDGERGDAEAANPRDVPEVEPTLRSTPDPAALEPDDTEPAPPEPE